MTDTDTTQKEWAQTIVEMFEGASGFELESVMEIVADLMRETYEDAAALIDEHEMCGMFEGTTRGTCAREIRARSVAVTGPVEAPSKETP